MLHTNEIKGLQTQYRRTDRYTCDVRQLITIPADSVESSPYRCPVLAAYMYMWSYRQLTFTSIPVELHSQGNLYIAPPLAGREHTHSTELSVFPLQ